MSGRRISCFCLLIALALASPQFAWTAGDSQTSVSSGGDRWDIEDPVPFDAEEASERYLATLSEEEREASDSYFEGGYWLQLWSLMLSLGLAWLLMAGGWSVQMRNMAEQVTRFKPVHTMVYLALYIPVLFLLTFPSPFIVISSASTATGCPTSPSGPGSASRSLFSSST